jgi:hypothetical protein
MKKALGACTMFVMVFFFVGSLVAQTDRFLGTWKLNVKKSKFVPGPPRKSETRIVVTGPSGMRVSVDRVNGDGSTQQFEYTTNLDGKTYPITGQGPYGADSISANLTACAYQKLGRPVMSEVMHRPNCHVLGQSSRGKSSLTGS